MADILSGPRQSSPLLSKMGCLKGCVCCLILRRSGIIEIFGYVFAFPFAQTRTFLNLMDYWSQHQRFFCRGRRPFISVLKSLPYVCSVGLVFQGVEIRFFFDFRPWNCLASEKKSVKPDIVADDGGHSGGSWSGGIGAMLAAVLPEESKRIKRSYFWYFYQALLNST